MKLIGEILAETCDLTQEAISQAILLQRGNGLRLGEILVGQNLVSESDLHNALSMQTRMKSSGPDKKSAWLTGIPAWLKIWLFGTAAVTGIWIVSSVLINLAKVYGQ